MRILVAGSRGQIASSLAEILRADSDIELRTSGRPELDLADENSMLRTVVAFRPEIVINAAAYTAVDKAELETDAAMRINADGAGTLAAIAANCGAPIVHLSTDYVFAGDKIGFYAETDPVGPLTAYGRSKLAGERLVAAANPRHVILRTAWVHSPFGTNFVRTMLRLAETRSEVSVVADQHGSPTFAPDIAAGLLRIARAIGHEPVATRWGVYHMTSTGSCTWADFAERVFERSREAGGPSAHVIRIATHQYPAPARRPPNSRLDCTKLRAHYGIALPDWTSGVDRCLTRLAGDWRGT